MMGPLSFALVFAGVCLVGMRPPQISALVRRKLTGTPGEDKSTRSRFWGFGRRKRTPALNPAVVLSEVATRLRAGAGEVQAWHTTLTRQNLLETPSEQDESVRRRSRGDSRRQTEATASAQSASEILGRVAGRYRRELQVESLRLCVEFCGRLGAPQAEVLEEIAGGINQDAVASAERQVAMAAPRLSGAILTGLPIIGVLAMTLTGLVDPRWFIGDAAGVTVGVAGVMLLVGGTLWMRRMVKAAENQ